MKNSFVRTYSGYGAIARPSKHLRAGLFRVFTGLAAISVAWTGLVSSAMAEGLRITALGDSLTQGYGLLPEEGLVPQLEGWLRARGHDVTISNAGVSGDTTAGGLARLDWTLAEPTQGMIVTLGGNDLLRGLDPALSRSNLAGILERLVADDIPALLVGLPAPGNYGPDFQAEFAAMYPELAQEFGTLLHPDLLAPINDAVAEGRAMQEVMQGDMIHPNPVGVALIVEALGPKVEELLAQIDAAH